MKYYLNPETNFVHAYNEDGSQDKFIPETFVRLTDEEVATYLAPTTEQIIAQYTAGVQKHLDDFARTRNYEGILSACTYATSLIPKFKIEGQYAVEVRDNTWASAYTLMAEVEAGTRPMPTLEELIAELPALVWPQ